MPAKTQIKKMEFEKEDEDFIKQLAKDVGCYYSRANKRTYNLNKFDSEIQSEMGVFAWVHKESDDSFWVSTRKIWVEEARAKVLAGRKATRINCFSRDTQRAGDSISLDTVSVLTLVKKLR
jgi:hypothetical protein